MDSVICICLLIFCKFNIFQGPPPKAGTFLSFGLGSHLCPGNELAKLEISVFLYHFLLKYKSVIFFFFHYFLNFIPFATRIKKK